MIKTSSDESSLEQTEYTQINTSRLLQQHFIQSHGISIAFLCVALEHQVVPNSKKLVSVCIRAAAYVALDQQLQDGAAH
eukprot:scaffold24530_cov22-Tisochrysis_lutea.AAC.3